MRGLCEAQRVVNLHSRTVRKSLNFLFTPMMRMRYSVAFTVGDPPGQKVPGTLKNLPM